MNSGTFPFAGAMPPRQEANFPTERWLTAIARAGYTHLCLQNDPFFHPEMDLRDSGENTFRLLSLYDMTTGPRHRSYLEWLGAVDARARSHGLRTALEIWEPRLTRLARHTLPPEWKGPPRSQGWIEPLCIGHPDARRWVLDAFQTLVRAMPYLDALVLGIDDNNAFLCGPDCPRCAQTPVMDRLGALYAEIERACRSVQPALRIIPYDWMWSPAHYEAVFSRLAGAPCILTRMERNADHVPDPEHPEWHGLVYDQCVGCDQLGADFRRSQRMMQAYQGELLVMPTLGGMFDSFHLPYVPAVGQIAKKFARMRAERVSGWLDYDCGGIHEGLMLDLVDVVQHSETQSVETWLDTLAAKRYGSTEAIGPARAIWDGFDRATRIWPGQLDLAGVSSISGRFAHAMGVLPLHPFLPERLRPEERERHFHFDPHSFARPETLEPMRTLIGRARDGLAEVPRLFAQLAATAPEAKQPTVTTDREMAEMVLLNWRSIANFFEWAAAHYGDASVDLRGILRDEMATTLAFRALAIRPELGYGNMTWHPERSVAMSVPQASADLWRAIEVNRVATWVNQPCLAQSGDLWVWKIAHLKRQLENGPAHVRQALPNRS